MRSRVKMSASFLFAIAAACMMVWPPAAAAATPDDGTQTAAPGLNFRFDEDVFALPATQATAETGTRQRFSRLAVRLYGGFSHVAAGDVNDGSDGFFELLALYGTLGSGTVAGGYSPVHAGYNFGADFIYQLSPSIGVGLGVGYLRSSRDSLMTLTETIATITLTGTPTLSAIPIRLGMFLTFPVAGKINLTADAGATCYAGLKFDASQRIELAADNWQVMSVSGSRTSFANLGFQGSLGFEYMFSPKMGFFVEAMGRYARFKNFDSVTELTQSSSGSPDTNTGKLYIDTFTYPEGTYSAFTIEATPPVDNPPTETFREPKIDLSGFSLQAGIRIRF